MSALLQQNVNTPDFRKTDISHLAEFLNVSIGDLDSLSAQEQANLLKQLVAISQLKLTRLALQH